VKAPAASMCSIHQDPVGREVPAPGSMPVVERGWQHEGLDGAGPEEPLTKVEPRAGVRQQGHAMAVGGGVAGAAGEG